MPKAAKAPAHVPLPTARPRDARIDLIRGLALATIYVNHIPGTRFEAWTSRNFGFSDAAEVFVLLAGISAALAYGRHLARRPLWPGVARIWGRAWQIYLVHVFVTVAVLALVAATLRFAGVPDLMLGDGFDRLVTEPLAVLTALPLLLHQFGYVNILPIYVLLLLAAPALLLAGMHRPGLLVAGSVALWAAAGLTRVNLPSWPAQGGWFLNPFSWQLLFVLGLLAGLGLRQGRALLPKVPALRLLAGLYLLLALLWVQVPAVAETGNRVMVGISGLGAPRLVTNFNKGFLELPRLLHVLALAYLAGSSVWLRRMAGSALLQPLALMGRHALPVFALGTILSFAARAVRTLPELPAVLAQTGLLDAALVLGGLLVLTGFAALCEAARNAARGSALPAAAPMAALRTG